MCSYFLDYLEEWTDFWFKAGLAGLEPRTHRALEGISITLVAIIIYMLLLENDYPLKKNYIGEQNTHSGNTF